MGLYYFLSSNGVFGNSVDCRCNSWCITLTGEVAILREENSNLSQKLIKAEAQANNLENEVHRVTQQLKDKGLLQEVLQREKDQAVTRGLEVEKTLHAEREQFSRDRARHEATQERLTQAQSEVMLLRQQLEEAQNKGLAKERAVTDAQGHLKDILSKLQSDYEERVQLVKERNKELDSKANDLQDHIHKLQDEKNEMKVRLGSRVRYLPLGSSGFPFYLIKPYSHWYRLVWGRHSRTLLIHSRSSQWVKLHWKSTHAIGMTWKKRRLDSLKIWTDWKERY